MVMLRGEMVTVVVRLVVTVLVICVSVLSALHIYLCVGAANSGFIHLGASRTDYGSDDDSGGDGEALVDESLFTYIRRGEYRLIPPSPSYLFLTHTYTHSHSHALTYTDAHTQAVVMKCNSVLYSKVFVKLTLLVLL